MGIQESVLNELITKPIPENLSKILSRVQELGIDEKRIKYEPTLARGLDYYTGIIIEVEIPEYTVGTVGVSSGSNP